MDGVWQTWDFPRGIPRYVGVDLLAVHIREMSEKEEVHRLIDAIADDLGTSSNGRAQFLYLLDPLLCGPVRLSLLNSGTPLSEVYYGMQHIASIGDAALTWMWYLLDACKASKHTKDLRKHIKSPVVRTSKPKLMLRMTLSSIASRLEDGEATKMITFVCRTKLQENPQNLSVNDGRGAFKAVLELFRIVEKRQIITPTNISALYDWLREIKRNDVITELVETYDSTLETSIGSLSADVVLEHDLKQSVKNRVCEPESDSSTDLEKLTMTPGATGAEVVQACVDRINSSQVLSFPDDNKILRRIAHVMSKDGAEMKRGYNGGVWQVSKFAFEDTGLKGTAAHYRLPSKYIKIREAFGVDWPSVKYEQLDVPFYSALGARLYLSNFAEPIPPASCVEEQAQYWHYIYMRGSPLANEDKFLYSVAELEKSL